MAEPTPLPFAYTNDLTGLPFTLVNDQDSQLINNWVGEAINIAGAPINVFKLLGIHEQTKLVDLTGEGEAISSGQYNAYPASNAFDNSIAEWRSIQKGTNVIGNSFIGYDFGPIRLDNARLRYGINTAIKKQITTISIKQGCDIPNRITKARVERSPDNKIWYGVDIITLPNTSDTVTIRIKQSAPSRYWRIVPLAFNGGSTDFWTVVELELIDFASTSLSDVQDDLGFLENRDRQYSTTSIPIKGYYDLVDQTFELSRLAGQMNDTQSWTIKVAFSVVVGLLGRPLVIGDILEIPSEKQYTPGLKQVFKYLEVTDVAWATDGYTPGWVPTMQRIIAMPAFASQETMDLFGDLNLPSNKNDFVHLSDQVYNIEAQFANQRIRAESNTETPERGEDIANLREFSNEEIAIAEHNLPGVNLGKLNIKPTGLYVQAAMPPNGLPYTEGPAFPSNPKNGDYHRLTYVNVPDPIPPRLFRFSLIKNRWIFQQQDVRAKYNQLQPIFASYVNDEGSVPLNEMGTNPNPKVIK